MGRTTWSRGARPRGAGPGRFTTGTNRTRRSSPGQVLALTAISLIALCALVGLAAGTGYFFDARRRIQTAADAAALAGAEQLRRAASGTTPVVTAANSAATANGFTDGVSGTTIAVHNPPSSGYYTADKSYVEAVISRDQPTLFLGLLGFPTGRVSARAVAGVEGLRNCVYALSPAGTGLAVNGSSTSLTANCGIVVDSSASGALKAGSGSVSGTSVTVTGTISGSCSTTGPSGCQTGIPPQPDPLATYADPQFSSCDFGASSPVKINGGVVTLSPGVYCNGIGITSGATVTFLPGLYVLNGGGLTVAGNSTILGTGVTFYNTARGYTYGAVTLTGGTVGALSAPTSGPTEGMLFFQDRTITPTGSQANNLIAGGTILTLEGMIYFPTTNLAFTGGSSIAANYTILVASTITVSGHSVLGANYDTLLDGDPIKKVTLAE